MIGTLLTFAVGTNHEGYAVSDFVVVYQAGFQLSLYFETAETNHKAYMVHLLLFWP